MTPRELLAFMRTHRVAVQAANLRANPAIALVMGGLRPGDERTVQYEGVADEPEGDERDRLTAAYYDVYPDGRDRLSWPGLTYVRALKPGRCRCPRSPATTS